MELTHWGRVTHICVGKLTIIGSDNGLSPGRRQAIIWTNAGILLIGPLGKILCEILIETDTISFKKMHLKMSSEKGRSFCLGLNVFSVTLTFSITKIALLPMSWILGKLAIFILISFARTTAYFTKMHTVALRIILFIYSSYLPMFFTVLYQIHDKPYGCPRTGIKYMDN